MRPPGAIAAVFFDAGGTLIHAQPAPGVVYAEVGRRFGSRIEAATASQRFRSAFSRRAGAEALATSEATEDAFWRSVVAEVLDDVSDFEACYRTLWAHFASAAAWQVDAAAGPVLEDLAARGLHVGVCSNFDSRLRTILAGKPALAAVRSIVISSEVGWRKPAPEFFQAVVQVAGVSPEQIVVVGDDRAHDYDGARAAGLAAILLDPGGRADGVERIGSLPELLKAAWLGGER
jgi:putative hydrolase of the HAD superfamily